jgi:iron-sulfur cluster repair protein YtfE (RIC family)
MTVTQELIQEHRDIEEKLQDFIHSDNIDQTELKKLLQDVQGHMVFEEETLFPATKPYLSKTEEIEMIQDSHEEHNEIKNVIIKLLGTSLNNNETQFLLKQLYEVLEHHHEDEETQVFPAIEERFSSEEFSKMTRKVRQHNAEHAGQFLPSC